MVAPLRPGARGPSKAAARAAFAGSATVSASSALGQSGGSSESI